MSNGFRPALHASALALWAAAAAAQTDEIQVYDGGLAERGTYNLTVHNNFISRGSKTASFEGAVTADRSWNGAFEWARGVTSWFEAGLYLPVYSRDQQLGWGFDAAKLRALFAVPDADHRSFFYGANFEFSINSERWDTARFTSEIRPIIGARLGRVDVIANPILDTAYDGFGNLEFVPALRLALNLPRGWAIAAEEYADLGPVSDFRPWNEQSHQLYAVVGHGGAVDVEAGVGFGLTSGSDKLTFKLILSRDLNAGRRRAAAAALRSRK